MPLPFVARKSYTGRVQPQPRPWIFSPSDDHLPLVDAAVCEGYLADEGVVVEGLLARLDVSTYFRRKVRRSAIELVEKIRRDGRTGSGIDALMVEYDLSSDEGVVLMCLAEALLRIPDAETADRLIAEKLGGADWQSHLGTGGSLFVNASTWALMLTGRLLRSEQAEHGWLAELAHAVNRLGEPVIRAALRQAMRILGHQFVMGRTIRDALRRAQHGSGPLYRYSFDMLGEAALTAADATRYFENYLAAISEIGRASPDCSDVIEAPSVSVKLSALSPRFEFAQSRRAVTELTGRVRELVRAAREANIGLSIDAEEIDRLDLTLAVFANALTDRRLKHWPGLGIAVQAYHKRGLATVEWLAELAAERQMRIPVRLVKGAYWDSEIKAAQAQGLSDYPVFTRKSNTDLSYLTCAARMLAPRTRLYPQFATHNAYVVAWVMERGKKRAFEFQRLHGMGEELYDELVAAEEGGRSCRVYAPVGEHEDLLPYLVRRLLENGANTSFVNRFVQAELPAADIVEDPVAIARALAPDFRHPNIPVPSDLFGAGRRNSHGCNFADYGELTELAAVLERETATAWRAAPIVDGECVEDGETRLCRDPADWDRPIAEASLADADVARTALEVAARSWGDWDGTPAGERGAILRRAADAFERHRAELIARCVREGGRTVPDGVAEVREAVDFLRYYAGEAERLLAAPRSMPGVTGESNVLRLRGRGVFLCISPWNFPLSIFTGQVVAALAAGNAVLAKPAEQGSLVAYRAAELLLDAGVPAGVLQFLPGDGASLGAAVLEDARLAGVAFTGSTETAAVINATLARRAGPLATLVAETGGINAMIVDSSALPEQVVKDAAVSAFNSAGQRCSALRLLCLQADTADRVIEMLEGYMRELVIGDPCQLGTDVGPVIDPHARQKIADYVESRAGRVRFQCELSSAHDAGIFFPPTLIELDRVDDLQREIFGPVLHVVRYEAGHTLELVDEINRIGYGLTLGVHSRIESVAAEIVARARVGNVYVNRNMIGAQVESQPFGGMGLSGTGPKAGGPHYLDRFLIEQAVSTNTAAVGGNASLLAGVSTVSEND